MKIGPLNKPQPVDPALTERKTPGKPGGPSARNSAAAEGGVKVAISAQATTLAADAGDGSFDAAKVARVSQAIKDGSYKVNAEAIADKLIGNARELLERTYR